MSAIREKNLRLTHDQKKQLVRLVEEKVPPENGKYGTMTLMKNKPIMEHICTELNLNGMVCFCCLFWKMFK